MPTANCQLNRMWTRYFKSHSTKSRLLSSTVSVFLGENLYYANLFFPRDSKIHVDVPKHSDPDNSLAKCGAHLSFTKGELEEGRNILEQMGVPADKPFVCVHARDSAYLKQIPHQFTKTDFSHHNHRNADILNYMSAMEELSDRGYTVIRMGSMVEKPIRTNNNSIIDYAESHWQNDFMDVYLSAHCDFFLCSNAGIHGLPRIFRRPVFYINTTELHGLWGKTNYFIPKKYRFVKGKRFLTFREILKNFSILGKFKDLKKEAGIELVENSPEEIKQASNEIHQRINGTWICSEEDEEDQANFQAVLKSFAPHACGFFRIGKHFLRHHRDLLN